MVSASLSCLLLIILITASLLGLATAAAAASRLPAADTAAISLRHEKWMAEHRRIYEDASEKTRRFEIFKLNVEYIDTVNNNISSSSSRRRRRKYKLGVNQFADLTNEEFKALHNGFRPKFMKATAAGAFENPAVVTTAGVPSAVDWRRKGAVTSVKNQGQCGSCWAFSAVASTEGIIKLKTGRLTALSVQELLDCDVAGVNKGCAGGATDAAFEFIIGNGGLATDASYPYEASAGTCNATAVAAARKKEATISGYVSVANIGEAQLAEEVARQPVSVAVDAGGPDFQFYAGGVFSGECGTDLNHGMAVVGFGKGSDGAKYWILKNSWGVSWGESGYMRLERDVGGLQEGGRCGVAMYAAYPTL